MNINYKQPQFELFPTNSATLEDVNKPKFLLANLTLSLESLVILVILGIMLALFSFSLGVERGKHLAAQALDERVSAAWSLAPRKAVVSVPPLSVHDTVSHGQHIAVKQPVFSAAHKQGNSGFIAQSRPILQTGLPVPASTAGWRQAGRLRSMVTATVPTVQTAIPAAKRFAVQAATYKNEVYAKQEAYHLKAEGFQTFLIKKGDFWLICLGPFTTRDAATVTLKKVQLKYPGSSIRRF